MSSHTYSVFANSCIKQPVDSVSKYPLARYERPISYLNGEMKITKISGASVKPKINQKKDIDDRSCTRSLVDFYDSIPDYNDLSLLDERDFYDKLDSLKETCLKLKRCSMCSFDAIPSDPNEFGLSDKIQMRSNSSTPHRNTQHNSRSKRSKKKWLLSSASSYYFDNNNTTETSTPDSTSTATTIVKVRGEEHHCHHHYQHNHHHHHRHHHPAIALSNVIRKAKSGAKEALHSSATNVSNGNSKRKRIKANPIPYTSKIPLYTHIMEEKKLKSQIAKLDSAMELQSKMKPFNFTKRSRSRCRSAKSLEDLTTSDLLSDEGKRTIFKTRRSFSNNDRELEYFRAINRKLRLEQLLKMSALPPSMAKREANATACSASSTSEKRSNSGSKKCKKGKRKGRRTPVIEAKDSLLGSFYLKDSKTGYGDPEVCLSQRPNSMPMYPASRPNVAANLRKEVSRKKLQDLEEQKRSSSTHKEISNRLCWGVRNSPAWKSLSYAETNDEDISMRLATRRAEQRLRQEEYSLHMELMRERVKAAPLLLEGLANGNRFGKEFHSCYPSDKFDCLHKTSTRKKKNRSNSLSCKRETPKLRAQFCAKLCKDSNSDSDELGSADRALL